MKFIEKVGYIIFSMLGLIVSIIVGLMSLNIINSNAFDVLISKMLVSQNNSIILLVCSVVLSLLAIRCLFFTQFKKNKDSEEGILMQNEDGQLLITKNTIETLAMGVASEIKEVQNCLPEVMIDKNNNVSMDVKIEVKDGAILKDVSSRLQTNIKNKVKKDVDLELKKVNILIYDFGQDEKTEE